MSTLTTYERAKIEDGLEEAKRALTRATERYVNFQDDELIDFLIEHIKKLEVSLAIDSLKLFNL
jgi:hypothetical protein